LKWEAREGEGVDKHLSLSKRAAKFTLNKAATIEISSKGFHEEVAVEPN
jgi:hypothetical protein